MIDWKLAQDRQPSEEGAFGNLDKVFAMRGEPVASDPLSDVVRVEVNRTRYYVKRYTAAAKNPFRRWLARPRVQAEWENLQRFQLWGIPTARLVAWGMERKLGGFIRGALVTEEIPLTEDMAHLARNQDIRLRDSKWVKSVSAQVAEATKALHSHQFAHNDLKWRNILVDRNEPPRVFLIDCPSGAFWPFPFIHYRKVKDIACLDKVAKKHLSSTQRLRFFFRYRGHARLTDADKRFIRQTLRFFEGRE